MTLTDTIREPYQLWTEKATADPDLIPELAAIADSEEEIYERFYRELEFGTAGLRGIIGAGTNRLNVYTIRKATQGLADFLNATVQNPSVAIAYDSRHKSDYFSQEAAAVLAANGIKVFIYSELMPTPMLSFAVRELGCDGGIVLTASHNPGKYNGFKCYGSDGCQMTDLNAGRVYEYITKLDLFDDVKLMSFEDGQAKGLIEFVPRETIASFYVHTLSQRVRTDVYEGGSFKVVYTPLNGTGNKPVREILARAGCAQVVVVKEQELPDGSFKTCPFPNPEIRQSFECALETAKAERPDLLLATDPDCDRVGIAVPDGEEYRLMSGNEVGCLLLNYILENRREIGTLPAQPVVIKTIVTTELAARIAEKYGCELINVLTGFKYIGEQIGFLEAEKQAERYVFGFEESYGYLAGNHVRDKDAVVASMLICEMAAYYKKQGRSLIELMDGIYSEYGNYLNSLLSFEFEGAAGMAKMKDLMISLRENPPTEFGGDRVLRCCDYLASTDTDLTARIRTEIKLPKSDVLSYFLEGGHCVIFRPSGTEPKLKSYITAVGADRAAAQAKCGALSEAARKRIEA